MSVKQWVLNKCLILLQLLLSQLKSCPTLYNPIYDKRLASQFKTKLLGESRGKKQAKRFTGKKKKIQGPLKSIYSHHKSNLLKSNNHNKYLLIMHYVTSSMHGAIDYENMLKSDVLP